MVGHTHDGTYTRRDIHTVGHTQVRTYIWWRDTHGWTTDDDTYTWRKIHTEGYTQGQINTQWGQSRWGRHIE